MFRYEFKIQIYDIRTRPSTGLGELTGFVQADRRSHACVRSWEIINQHTDRLRADGLEVGVGDLYCERYVEQALGV